MQSKRERQTDRQTGAWTDRQTSRQKDKETHAEVKFRKDTAGIFQDGGTYTPTTRTLHGILADLSHNIIIIVVVISIIIIIITTITTIIIVIITILIVITQPRCNPERLTGLKAPTN